MGLIDDYGEGATSVIISDHLHDNGELLHRGDDDDLGSSLF